MIDIAEKRFLIASCYGDSWKEKVGKMSENQVEALYKSFVRRGKIDDNARREYASLVKENRKLRKNNYIPLTYEQLAEKRNFVL